MRVGQPQLAERKDARLQSEADDDDGDDAGLHPAGRSGDGARQVGKRRSRKRSRHRRGPANHRQPCQFHQHQVLRGAPDNEAVVMVEADQEERGDRHQLPHDRESPGEVVHQDDPGNARTRSGS